MNCHFERPPESSEAANDTCKLSTVRLFPNYEKWKIVSSVGGRPRIDHTLQNEGSPYSKVHGANMGPIWGRQDPGGPNVGTMNFAIWVEQTEIGPKL